MARLLPRAAVGGGVLLVVGLTAFVVGSGDGDSPTPSSDAAPGPEVVLERTPATWRIVYRVTTGSGDETSTLTDVVEVRRPFEGRVETYLGDDPDADPQSLQISTFGRRLLDSRDADPSVVAYAPDVAAPDVRLEPLLEAAVDGGRLERRERREVAGRPCQVLRSDGPLGGGPLTPIADDAHTDSCVDAAGLVLEESIVVDGDRILHRIATEVDEDVALADGRFLVGDPTLPVDRGGGSVLRVAAGSVPPGAFWVLDDADVPARFESCGRFSVVPPQPEQFGDPEQEWNIVASTVDVWVDGTDLLVVEQGATLGGRAPFQLGGHSDVDLGSLGSGEVLLDPRGNEVRTLLGSGGFLVVSGTLPPDELVDVARSLREVEGGELRIDRQAPLRCPART